MRGRTCYGSEVFGDTYQRSIVFAHAFFLKQSNINYNYYKYETENSKYFNYCIYIPLM